MHINVHAPNIFLLSFSALNGHLFESALHVINVTLLKTMKLRSYSHWAQGLHPQGWDTPIPLHSGSRIPQKDTLPRRLRSFRLNCKRSPTS
jgi:hypothetical protein